MNEHLIVKFRILVGLTENIIIRDFKSRLFPFIHQNMDIWPGSAAAVGECDWKPPAGKREAGRGEGGRRGSFFGHISSISSSVSVATNEKLNSNTFPRFNGLFLSTSCWEFLVRNSLEITRLLLWNFLRAISFEQEYFKCSSMLYLFLSSFLFGPYFR